MAVDVFTSSSVGPAAAGAVGGWILTALGTFVYARLYLHARGEPPGWRFNHHGAGAVLGHLSFYERGGGGAVVIQSVTAFPLYWTVRRKPEDGASHHGRLFSRPGSELEPVFRGPVWRAVPWAHRYMANRAVLSRMDGDDCPR